MGARKYIGIRGISMGASGTKDRTERHRSGRLYRNEMYNKPSLCGIKTKSLKGYCFLYFFPPLKLAFPITTYAAAASFAYL